MVQSHAGRDAVHDGRGESQADPVAEHGLPIGQLGLRSFGRGVRGPERSDKAGVDRTEAQQQQRLRRGRVVVIGQPGPHERRAQNKHHPAESQSGRQEGGSHDRRREQNRCPHKRQVREDPTKEQGGPSQNSDDQDDEPGATAAAGIA